MQKIEIAKFFNTKNFPLKIEFYLNTIYSVKVDIGILKVSGNFPKGSAGNIPSNHLAAIHVFLREYFSDIEALILDFQDLNYSMGNRLTRVISPKIFEDFKPTEDNCWLGTHLVLPNNNAPILDLIKTFPKEFVQAPFLANSIEEAIQKIIKNEKEIFKDIPTPKFDDLD